MAPFMLRDFILSPSALTNVTAIPRLYRRGNQSPDITFDSRPSQIQVTVRPPVSIEEIVKPESRNENNGQTSISSRPQSPGSERSSDAASDAPSYIQSLSQAALSSIFRALASLQTSTRASDLLSGLASTSAPVITADGRTEETDKPSQSSAHRPSSSGLEAQRKGIASLGSVSTCIGWMKAEKGGWATDVTIWVFEGPLDIVCWIDVLLKRKDAALHRGDSTHERVARHIFGTNTERHTPGMPECPVSYKGRNCEKDEPGSNGLLWRWSHACSDILSKGNLRLNVSFTTETICNLPPCPERFSERLEKLMVAVRDKRTQLCESLEPRPEASPSAAHADQ